MLKTNVGLKNHGIKHFKFSILSFIIIFTCLSHATSLNTTYDSINPRDPLFLYLAGFEDNKSNANIRRNTNPKIEFDNHEKESPENFLKINLDHYFNDKEYTCRKPSLARYFKKYYPSDIYQEECPQTITMPLTNNRILTPIKINPDHVYRIDYMMVSPGASAVSHFGHSMFQIIVCSKSDLKKGVGPHCANSLTDTYHLALAFQADIPEFSLDFKKGLNGEYTTRLFVQPISEIKQQYATQQLRSIRSYPLNFNREQIRNFIELAAETAWNYQGKYYFLKRNCAVEAKDLLFAVTGNLKLYNAETVRPQKLLNTLIKLDLINKPTNLDIIKDKTLYYHNDTNMLNQALDVLVDRQENSDNNQSPINEFNENEQNSFLKRFLFRTTVAERKTALTNKLKTPDLSIENLIEIYQSAIRLENQSLDYLLKINSDLIFIKMKNNQTTQMREQTYKYNEFLKNYLKENTPSYGLQVQTNITNWGDTNLIDPAVLTDQQKEFSEKLNMHSIKTIELRPSILLQNDVPSFAQENESNQYLDFLNKKFYELRKSKQKK